MEELNFMSFEEFYNKVHNLDSGVYLITDHNDKIVYVGKAFKIKTRVQAHFNGYSNTKDYAHIFNKVAYILEDSPLKRSLLEITYMIEYKTILNKEVQEEFPDLYTEYIKQTNKKCSSVVMLREIDEAMEQAKIEDIVRDLEKETEQNKRIAELEKQKEFAEGILELQRKREREREKLKKDLIRAVGGKSMLHEIISFLDNGYNPHILSKALNIDCQAIITIKEHRKDFHVPRNHKRMIKHQDIMYSLTGQKSTGNSRLNHLL